MNVSWTNASESYVNIATAKPVMDATNAAASKPSGLPLVRATRPSRRTIRTISQTHPTRPSSPTSRNSAEPLVVEDRGVAERVVGSGLSRAQPCPRSGLRMPSMSLGLKLARPLMRVGSPASVRCRRDQAWPATGKKRLLQGRDRSRSDDLDDDQHGNRQRQEREDVTRAKPQQSDGRCHDRHDRRPRRSREHADQDHDVGTHQARDRDFASATPSGTTIANRTPSAIG